MAADLPVRCACGALTGRLIDLRPATANNMVCHCRGCRAYAAHMGREAQMLDAHGGVRVFQVSPAALVFDGGAEHLACLRMTAGGALRWYAGCCRTPIASGLDRRGVPFVSMHPLCVDWGEVSLEARAGPVRVRVNRRFPRAERRALKAGVGALLAMLARYGWMCLRWVARGDHRRSPFFERQTAAPVAEPVVVGLPDDFR